MKLKKNMSHGSRFLIKFIFLILFQFQSYADDKISSTPLLNLNEIKPSFDDTDLSEIESASTKNLKNKLNKKSFKNQLPIDFFSVSTASKSN